MSFPSRPARGVGLAPHGKARSTCRRRYPRLFGTTETGYRIATSVGGSLTGRGGDYLIIDDPTKSEDAWSDSRRDAANRWFTNTAISRLDDKQAGGILIVMQRHHVEDLVGHVIDKSGEDWAHLKLSAIAQEDEHFALPDGRVFTGNLAMRCIPSVSPSSS